LSVLCVLALTFTITSSFQSLHLFMASGNRVFCSMFLFPTLANRSTWHLQWFEFNVNVVHGSINYKPHIIGH